MDSLNLGSADNKGILSLLSAIEQSGDNFETDPDSPPPIKETEFNQLDDSLDLSLTLNRAVGLCLICGQTSLMEPSDSINMIDISMQISGIKIAEKIEDIVSRKIVAEKHSSLICSECYGVLQHIDKLEGELLQCKRNITSKFSVSNPVKQAKNSPKKTLPMSSFSKSIPTTLDYTSVPPLDTKMPMNFMASEKEIERDILHMRGKSKLDILTDTVREYDDMNYAEEDQPLSSSILECETCQRKFKSSSLYQKHMKSHAAKEKVHKCKECGKVMTTKSNLQAHLKTHFEAKVFTCPHCNKELKGKKSLLDHIAALHNKEKRFSCIFCPEQFTSRHLKNVHERLHNGERGFICDQCGDSFATSQGLSNHRSKHTGDFQLACEHCEKGFNSQKLLEEHQHIHTGNKPYRCNKCEAGFGNRGSLWLHMKKHENLKPYQCTECKKSFSHSSHLATHKRLHTGEKPYKCRICSEGFISSNNLRRHMKSHSNQLPYGCGVCKQTFSQRKQLVAHSNQLHGGNVVEETNSIKANGNVKNEEVKMVAAETSIESMEDDGYSLMPVSIVEDGMLTDAGAAADQQRIVDLLSQDGVGLGQTIVLIQVPSEHGDPTQVKTIEVDRQN